MFSREGIKYEDNIDAALVCEDWGSTHEPSMENFKKSVQPWALDLKLKGTREPSTGRQSQYDPGLEREVERDEEATEIVMAFGQQGLGGDWRLATAVQQPSYVELRQPDKYVFFFFIWVQYIWFDFLMLLNPGSDEPIF